MAVEEQIVTGQSGAAVVKLIQDSVLVCFWLTQLDPQTLAPMSLSPLQYSQLLADMDLESLPASLDRLRRQWETFTLTNPSHPLVRSLVATNRNYIDTGFAIFSLCLPSACTFTGRKPVNYPMLSEYARQRRIPVRFIPLEIRRGIFLGGMPTSDTLSGVHGLLNHIFQQHGPQATMQFISHVQRLASCASMYGYAPSIGLNDCLFSRKDRSLLRDETQFRVMGLRQRKAAPKVPYSMEDTPGYSTGVDASDIADLIGISTVTHQNVRDVVLRRRHNGQSSSINATMASSTFTNQAALLCMLGTKGSLSNLAQCSHSLGQQVIQDNRVPAMDFNRVFPHNTRDAVNDESRGLLWNESFVEGLSPQSFFLHAIAGREALVECATIKRRRPSLLGPVHCSIRLQYAVGSQAHGIRCRGV